MSKSKGIDFFEDYAACMALSCEAAVKLHEVLSAFDPTRTEEEMQAIHALEHRADERKHDFLAALSKAFITPIERDDMIQLIQALDDVTDAVEDIIIHIHITGVRNLRGDALAFSALLIRCCKATHTLMQEFRDFKKSKKMGDRIVEVNQLEEEGDRMYISAMAALHREERDPLTVLAWREIYKSFERVCDACEDVADIVETILIGNL